MDLYSSNLCCSKINCISNLLKEKKSLDWKFCKNFEIFRSQSVLSCLKLYKLYKIGWEVFPLPVFSREVCSLLGWSSRTRRRRWHPTPVLLLGKSHGWRSLVGCSPWGRWGSDTTEWLHFHFSLSCIGEGNGNPLQCSCLENPGDGEPGGLPSMGSHRVGHVWSDLVVVVELNWCFLYRDIIN